MPASWYLGHCAATDAQQKNITEKIISAVFFMVITSCFRTKIALRCVLPFLEAYYNAGSINSSAWMTRGSLTFHNVRNIVVGVSIGRSVMSEWSRRSFIGTALAGSTIPGLAAAGVQIPEA